MRLASRRGDSRALACGFLAGVIDPDAARLARGRRLFGTPGAPAAQRPVELGGPARQKSQGDGREQDGQEDKAYKLLRVQA